MGNFEDVVKYRKPCGSSQIAKLYKLVSCNWRINNSDGFPENTQCFKIHCFDEYDDVIDVFGSQHHEIAKKVAQIKYDTQDFKKFYQAIIVIYEIESQLHDAISKIIEPTLVTEMMQRLDKTELHLCSMPPQQISSANLVQVSFKENKQLARRGYTLIEENFSLLEKKSFNIDFIKQTLLKTKDSENFARQMYMIFHPIVVLMSELEAGCLRLQKVTGEQHNKSFDKFISFLQVLEVFGSGYRDDVHHKKYKLRETLSHQESTVQVLERIEGIFRVSINILET